MKKLINQKEEILDKDLKIEICTLELLKKYTSKFGTRYVIQNYKINKDLIKFIENGDCSDLCDEYFTLDEIITYQSRLN